MRRLDGTTVLLLAIAMFLAGLLWSTSGREMPMEARADLPPISALEACEQERAAWKGRYQNDPRSMWAGEVPRDEGGR